MRNFQVTVNGKTYDVAVEELGASASTAPAEIPAAAPAPAAKPAAAGGTEL